MKLTLEQIAKIDEALVLNGIIYEDIKLEMTDHIASEIEYEMTKNATDFEIAFKEVFKNWKEQFKLKTYGVWLGNYSGAKIFMDRFLQFTIDEYKAGFCLLVIFMIQKALNFDVTFTDDGANFTIIALKALLCIVFIITVTGRIMLKKHQFKTTFSEIFKRRFYLTIVYFFGFILGAFPILPSLENNYSDSYSIFLVIIFIFYNLNSFRLVAKHFKIKKQFEKSFAS